MGIKRTRKKALLIGLTGNIACGKSTVAKILKRTGIPIVDADHVSREVCKKGSPVLKQIAVQLSLDVFTKAGTLDRKKLRKLVFSDSKKRKILEKIMHPAIKKRSEASFRDLFKKGHPLVIYEASLLIETGRQKNFDGILLVTSPEKDQLKRIKKRDPSISAKLAQKMICAQMPQLKKMQYADWVIQNCTTLDELQDKVTRWIDFVLNTSWARKT